ncbi:hypothetical protein PMI42_03294 [Bradyrhizobium sp. YR681]|uniref:hypothetical protein n=1 Tax=Bradyrhizobium sp. YR681 TaxID=1144344 RepID=UPI000271412B|nr:hypothetical protein [Bradyrhizobium sp. YR681]EJN13438.1 hypothetical protein PMI42_03294 [Bradyrhizobium sp. YR681]
MLIRKLACVGLVGMLLALTSRPASSRDGTHDGLLIVSLAMSPEISLREQYINQSILSSMVLGTRRLPDVATCDLHLLIQLEFVFGEFGLAGRHENPAMLVKCLRAAVNYLLREDVAESDFIAARAFEARMSREWSEPNPKDLHRADGAAERLALLAIYRKHSPLHQMHSIDADAIAATSFDDFTRWLERNRRLGRFTLHGSKRLLEALELPVPDPMVLRLVTSLASPRTPAGVLTFDGDRVGVPALIALFLAKQGSSIVDERVKRRFACNKQDPAALGDGYGAIARASCQTSDKFGEIWLTLAFGKVESASYSEFCRQVLELSRDEDIATTARFSPDGPKGLYVLLPPACKASD